MTCSDSMYDERDMEAFRREKRINFNENITSDALAKTAKTFS